MLPSCVRRAAVSHALQHAPRAAQRSQAAPRLHAVRLQVDAVHDLALRRVAAVAVVANEPRAGSLAQAQAERQHQRHRRAVDLVRAQAEQHALQHPRLQRLRHVHARTPQDLAHQVQHARHDGRVRRVLALALAARLLELVVEPSPRVHVLSDGLVTRRRLGVAAHAELVVLEHAHSLRVLDDALPGPAAVLARATLGRCDHSRAERARSAQTNASASHLDAQRRVARRAPHPRGRRCPLRPARARRSPAPE